MSSLTRPYASTAPAPSDPISPLPSLLAAAALAFVWLFATLALLSYSAADPAWSTSGASTAARASVFVVHNWLGQPGAYVADLSYFLCGFSVWWLVLVCARKVLGLWAASLRRTKADAGAAMAVSSASPKLLWLVAFFGLVAASCVLEWSRLHSWDARLPGRSGGVVGDLLGPMLSRMLGENAAPLGCVAVLVICLPVVLGFSWGRLAQGIGGAIELWFARRRDQREQALDLAEGERAAKARASPDAPHAHTPVVPTQSAHAMPDALAEPAAPTMEAMAPWDDAQTSSAPATANQMQAPEAPTLRIEPSMSNVPLPQSDRVIKERQQGLFAEIPETKLPQVALLDAPPAWQETVSPETLEMTSRLIEKKLSDFGVKVHVLAASPGPVITRYEIEPAVGVKGSQVVNLAKDLARSLSLVSIRVIETIPGKNFMALELPNAKRQTIRLSEILGSKAYNSAKSNLAMGLGKDIVGNPVVVDLQKMPHCLVAGTTGSGKSVGINGMILSLLYKAEAKDVRLLLIDPKMLEMSVYEGIPHLIAPVVTDMSKAGNGLNWCVNEMERRYRLMSKMGVRNLDGYNNKIAEAKARGELITNPFSLTPDEPEPLDHIPYIVVVIDELADLMMVVGKKIEELIARLAQKARASGIHLVLATQRPSVDVITGLIKANIPTRLSFQVSSKIDSRTILDQMGAEALLGMGDMLYLPVGQGLPTRVHGAFVSDDEVHRVVAYLKTQGEPNYIEGVLEGGTVDEDGPSGAPGSGGGGESDALYDRAVDIVLKNNKASISLVQRHLGIGYNKAANLLDAMEKAGLVSAMNNRGSREILGPNRDM